MGRTLGGLSVICSMREKKDEYISRNVIVRL